MTTAVIDKGLRVKHLGGVIGYLHDDKENTLTIQTKKRLHTVDLHKHKVTIRRNCKSVCVFRKRRRLLV